MKKKITYLLIFVIIGLVLGYLFFGKIAGEYVSLKVIFGSANNPLEGLGRNLSGITDIKQNILISGVVGAVVGIVFSVLKKK